MVIILRDSAPRLRQTPDGCGQDSGTQTACTLPAQVPVKEQSINRDGGTSWRVRRSRRRRFGHEKHEQRTLHSAVHPAPTEHGLSADLAFYFGQATDSRAGAEQEELSRAMSWGAPGAPTAEQEELSRAVSQRAPGAHRAGTGGDIPQPLQGTSQLCSTATPI